ncbi:hypothetical protein H0H87_005086, partial [Tephrocybe sp. NHM501043]
TSPLQQSSTNSPTQTQQRPLSVCSVPGPAKGQPKLSPPANPVSPPSLSSRLTLRLSETVRTQLNILISH